MKEKTFELSGNLVDVVSGEIYGAKIFVEKGVVVRVGREDCVFEKYLVPGLIDSHVHVESSMLVPSEFARLAVRRGTVAVVSDPHEIANVLGVAGVDFMIEDGRRVPFKFFFGAPSCVPATSFESSGFVLDSLVVDGLLKRNDIYFLSEMMNFPGVIWNDKDVWAKLESARKYGKPVDGHAPFVAGDDLIAYAKGGITTDHESTNADEAVEKIKLGIKLQIREGSAAKDFDSLCEVIEQYPDMVMLCTDDSHPDDLMFGHIDKLIKKGLAKKIDVMKLLRCATLNPVKHYNLPVGLLQVGDSADFIVVDDLKNFNVMETYIDGVKVFDGNDVLFRSATANEINNFNCGFVNLSDVEIAVQGANIRVMEIVEGQLITKQSVEKPTIVNGKVCSDVARDLLKIVVLNRYSVEKMKPVVGFVKNFGLKKGAVATTIAHDSHNIIAIGVSDADIVSVINRVVENKGGLVVTDGHEIKDIKLNIAGLMTNEDGLKIGAKYQELNNWVKTLGTNLHAPFMTLSFMALLVIPELKIGDKSLFDVNQFKPVSLFVE